MHEIIIEDIIEEAKKHGKVTAIKLEVGELFPLNTVEIQSLLREKTNWRIEIENKTSDVSCTCGYEGPAKILQKGSDYTLFSCPRCNSIPKVNDGDDVNLKEVRIL